MRSTVGDSLSRGAQGARSAGLALGHMAGQQSVLPLLRVGRPSWSRWPWAQAPPQPLGRPQNSGCCWLGCKGPLGRLLLLGGLPERSRALHSPAPLAAVPTASSFSRRWSPILCGSGDGQQHPERGGLGPRGIPVTMASVRKSCSQELGSVYLLKTLMRVWQMLNKSQGCSMPLRL